jgi:hypothetical protein
MRVRHSGDYSSIDERAEKIYKRLSDLFIHHHRVPLISMFP